MGKLELAFSEIFVPGSIKDVAVWMLMSSTFPRWLGKEKIQVGGDLPTRIDPYIPAEKGVRCKTY